MSAPGGQSLLADILDHLGRLLRRELDLITAEFRAALGRAGVALGLLALAVALALTGFNALVGAATAGLVALGLDPGWAGLIVGLVLVAVAWALGRKALGDLDRLNLVPRRSRDNLRRDAETIKETLK
ncbi:phage holin family protein [Maritimibacter fusiformis]|uniref:Phage holin family protein n=1 Tax=Maritimibacter fusiformis TaxID=2603819 RepID=A0A5D0RK66_9RHOB|nr:phage holin family protein [Maritimibacter fusiformis]TYB81271.1 phage holin family protein [Maritimibacter fusiformis]